jgi:hypothetical protein
MEPIVTDWIDEVVKDASRSLTIHGTPATLTPMNHTAGEETSIRRKSQELFATTFTYPEGSTQRLQAFKEYLKALRDEHAR